MQVAVENRICYVDEADPISVGIEAIESGVQAASTIIRQPSGAAGRVSCKIQVDFQRDDGGRGRSPLRQQADHTW